MREEFTGLDESPRDVWIPVTMYEWVARQDLFGATQPRALSVIARLRPGVTAAHVQSALTPFVQRIIDRPDDVRAELELRATPNPVTLELIAILSPVFAAFGLVLVTACANVANVMLARANTRHREISVRLSLGASRSRVVRQLLTEGLVLSVLAALAGLGLAGVMLRLGTNAFVAMLPAMVC